MRQLQANRRTVLKGAAGALAGLALPPLAAPALAAETLDVAQIGTGLALVTGAGGNILVRSTSAGQVLVDSGAAAFNTAVLDALAGLPGGRVAKLFNTHWHLDQVGGNAELGKAGAVIVAHAKTLAHLATDYYLPAEERYEKALPPEARPTETFYSSGTTTVGEADIEYGYLLEAHTDGDIYVFLRDLNVMALGDAISPTRDPVLDWFGGGWLGGRVDSLAEVLEITDAETRFVPGYGPVVGRAEVKAEHDLMLEYYDLMVEHVRLGESAEDILATGVVDKLERHFDDPLKFLYDAHKGMWAHYNTLSPDIV